METLPAELLIDILSYIPPSNYPSLRLTSRAFAATTKKAEYAILASFIDPDVALATLEEVASDLTRRPRAIWSPSCSVPQNLVVPESFLLAMYAGLSGRSWPARERISVDGMAKRLRRNDVSEANVRQALFRYALYLSYISEPQDDGPLPHERILKNSFGY